MNHRSRLVAWQMQAKDASGLFCPAPPLEALRTVLSLAVTEIGSHRRIFEAKSRQQSQIAFST